MTKKVFTKKEVAGLWKYQFGPWEKGHFFHPYTCENRDRNHPKMAGDKGILVPTVRGWICPFCDYTQEWAHGVNKNE